MNFVDVQPKSFLDYAWTSPSPTALTAVKSSKTSRKQNRCCDQCRKGKRACDAAILEDALLDDNKGGANPPAFHYSDVFGPLAPCGNCEKTKKGCTFEWLRSQRLLQSTQQPPNPLPPPKRRRTSSSKSSGQDELRRQITGVGPANQRAATNDGHSAPRAAPLEMVTFGDFPCGMPTVLDPEDTMNMFESTSPFSVEALRKERSKYLDDMFEDSGIPFDCDSGKGSSLETLSERPDDVMEKDSSYTPSAKTTSEASTTTNGSLIQLNRKKRRRGSSSSTSNGALPCPALSFASDLVLTTNNAFLTEGLLRIYHNSFENALSCWVTERTCPYSTKADVALINDARPDWNRIYHRVFRLDRLAANIRGRQLTYTEDQAASRALNLAIYSFATQWAQSSQRSTAKYPFDAASPGGTADVDTDSGNASGPEFDRMLQIRAWHEAQNALHIAGEIESFRVVLAQIVFALTQKPVEAVDVITDESLKSQSVNEAGFSDVDEDVSECEDLLSKLNLAIDADGPPTHLEQGLRLIHSLRSRMAMYNGKSRLTSGALRGNKQYRPSTGRLDNADRAAVDLLFWLGVMFDTLSAAMNKRPLVVSDEDSDIYPNGPEHVPSSTTNGSVVIKADRTDGLWDGYLFARQEDRLQENPVRWPCSFDQAAALLCDAAPVKVVLFRKITRIQTLLTRNARGAKVESALKAALDVCAHWEQLYAPFISDCIQNHDQLHPRIQSWYTCLAGHWHLATLLLADLIEIVDESELGTETNLSQRASTDFLARFRENNCRVVSDMARCACPRENATFSRSPEFHFALNEGSLLTEPWTAVLIRAFAKAGVILLESDVMLPSLSTSDIGDAFQRADDCVRALWYLGRKSDMALAAAKILGNALKERRKGVEEKVNDMSAFLEAELWHGFDDLEAFGVDCET
ncbi:hypothetical protein FB567DRAFT_594210 [Paraphoma chrysanthemicola]|uniref:Zn(2)-C6 fungal-type domain-containing protein n=1 Tax=Paraphoma chrysanthemicola TaxID=798071 RepID=A0A8K0VWE2_9PLEO|nr:hypothetical protein FB567DRAFT_594210 [Paraphoma chrysanthemicola]